MNRTVLVVVLASALAGCVFRSHESQPKVTPADPGKILVYVFTDPPASRLVTMDEQARTEATGELAHRLRGRKNLSLVDTQRQADVVVELLSAAQVFNPKTDRTFDDRQMIAEITAAGKTARLTAARGDAGRTVYSLAKSVGRWIDANRTQIVAARPK